MNNEPKNSKKRMKYKSGGRYISVKKQESIPLEKVEGISFTPGKIREFYWNSGNFYKNFLFDNFIFILSASVYYVFKIYYDIYLYFCIYILMS